MHLQFRVMQMNGSGDEGLCPFGGVGVRLEFSDLSFHYEANGQKTQRKPRFQALPLIQRMNDDAR